jgi:hypothetical protein
VIAVVVVALTAGAALFSVTAEDIAENEWEANTIRGVANAVLLSGIAWLIVRML